MRIEFNKEKFLRLNKKEMVAVIESYIYIIIVVSSLAILNYIAPSLIMTIFFGIILIIFLFYAKSIIDIYKSMGDE